LRLTHYGNQRLSGKWMFVNYDQLGRVVSTGLGVWNGEDPNIPDEIVPPNEGGISPFFTYQYYDTYDSITDPNLQFDTASAFHEKSNRIRGRETGSKVKYIDGGIEKWLTSVVYYDKYGRAVQSISKNNVGGYDITNTRYNFAGELLESKQKHTNYNNQTKYLVYLYQYDETGRLLNLRLSQNENGSDAVMIDSLTYHETGQVKEKRMHSENGTGFLQTVDYTYNIRGALTFMNNPDNLNGDLFAMRLFYDKNSEGGFNTYKDGKISSMEWNSMKLDGKQTYTYTYDNANRLTGATFTPSGRYDMTFAYDKNGNITNLTRNGQIITNAVKDGVKTEIISYGTIDNLSYGYTGNQLLTVSDLIGSVTTQLNNDFRDNGINLRTEYEYDANGNMTKDLNKGISLVTYNHLNQPVEVVMSKGKTIYTYAATGLKLKTEEYIDGSLSKTNEYSGAFVYENAQLSYINIPDGRYVVATGKYEYNLTDHLGNVHVTFTKNASGDAVIIQEDHYYPFGLQMSGQHFENTTFLNKYLYNGKEKQTQTGYYDYGFRQLDPQLCRWHVADAMAESYLSTSPYAYVENNPISFMDYMGLWAFPVYFEGDLLGYASGEGNNWDWVSSGGGGSDNQGTGHMETDYDLDYEGHGTFSATAWKNRKWGIMLFNPKNWKITKTEVWVSDNNSSQNDDWNPIDSDHLLIKMSKEYDIYRGAFDNTENDDLISFDIDIYKVKDGKRTLYSKKKLVGNYGSYLIGGINKLPRNYWMKDHDKDGDIWFWHSEYAVPGWGLFIEKGNAWMQIHPGSHAFNFKGCWTIGNDIYFDNKKSKTNPKPDYRYEIPNSTNNLRDLHNLGYQLILLQVSPVNSRSLRDDKAFKFNY
jgi:RHS repeat-associated protein